MKMIINLIVTAVIVYLLANFLPGVHVDGFGSSIIVVIVLALLNFLVKPLLQLIAIPITILTLGLFLFVINALIIMLCSYIVGGFQVNGFFPALLFSLVLSIVQSIVGGLMNND
ncbi:phage holin family protein [Paenimyroides aestuarii]|uniref:Phage holin family protein n=1 Tax=Paenimyroides aestuarii TaxID=2968490 RepID=A0ABY5NPA4_9FLAO|nr:phage holin family protein [Paenimyroides aestuarii]UUV20360.1 phage holin family protein [Paenimyroides aestuarii]